MALTKTQVSALYVAIFNRASEGEGNQYWQNTGLSASEVADQMLATQDAQDYFGDSLDSDQAFIEHIYLNTLNKTLDDDPGGIAFWVEQLQHYTRGEVVAGLIEAVYTYADSTDPVTKAAYDQFVNRVNVSNFMADTIEKAPADYATSTSFNADLPVTDSVSSVNDALIKIADMHDSTQIDVIDHTLTLKKVVNETVTVVSHEGDTVAYWGDPDCADCNITLNEFTSMITTVTGLSLNELGVADIDGAAALTNVTVVTSDTDSDAGGDTTITYTTATGEQFTSELAIAQEYINFIDSLIYYTDADGNKVSRFTTKTGDTTYTQDSSFSLAPIILTTAVNNGGTYENGFTTDENDLIVVGQTELLHGAYIDGGGGINTLEVDMKGVYAQPIQLLNIQNVNVQNLPNVYGDYYDLTNDTNLDGYNIPDYLDGTVTNADSVLDLSRATSLEKLTITEGINLTGGSGLAIGDLTIVGVRNGAETVLQGSFTEDRVNVYYSAGEMTDGLNLTLNLGDVGETKFGIFHTSNTVNINSIGGGNVLASLNLDSATLTNINVSGTAEFTVTDTLASNFTAGHPAVIDASANVAGVDLNVDGFDDAVVFTGTIAANDHFSAINHDGKSVSITGGDGNNEFDATAKTVTIVSGNGDNIVNATSSLTDTSVTTGDGDDVIRATSARSLTVDAGNGNNSIEASASVSATITSGAGNDSIKVIADKVVVNAGDGDNSVELSSFASATVTTGEGDDTVSLAPGSGLITFDLGAGSNTVNVENFTALENSSITGENISINVTNDYPVDLSNAALSGITSVTLNDSTVLTITAEQFTAIGASAFHAIDGDTAKLNIVVTQDTNLSDLGDLTQLDSDISFSMTVTDGATLTLTAEQLDKYISEGGINVSDNVDNQVVVTNAGSDFDPFADSVADGITGGGTITGTTDVTVQRTIDGYERPAEDSYSDAMTIDSDATPVVGDVTSAETNKLVITGDADLTLGAVDLASAFTVDFSGLSGTLNSNNTLYIANFNEITNGEQVGEIIGNGAVRVNVGLDGDLQSPDVADPNNPAAGYNDEVDNGLHSSGVSTYVVTELDGITPYNFYVCDNTQDLQVLGLQGNYDGTVNFMQVQWGVEFLMEGDGEPSYTLKANGNPAYSNVGTLTADFRWDGAPAVVNINNQGVDTARPIHVAGIDIDSAKSITINGADSDIVIANLDGKDVEDLVFNSEDNVTVENYIVDTITSLDASGVAGTFTLELAEGNHDLSAVVLSDVDALVLSEGSTVTLTNAQLQAIGAGNVTSDFNSVMNVILDDQPFDSTAIDSDITVNVITADGTYTLDSTTDLTAVSNMTVSDNTNVTINADQAVQLTGATFTAGATGNLNITGVDQTHMDVDANADGISDLGVVIAAIAAAGVAGTLTITGDMTLDAATLNAAALPASGGFELVGSNDPDLRVNVDMSVTSSQVGTNADNGVHSVGIPTYVVTELDGAPGAQDFFVCNDTHDLTTLGLQGNGGDAISFAGVKRGVSFLMEGDGFASWEDVEKNDTTWNESNIGALIATFYTPNNPLAVVNINNQGVGLTDSSSSTITNGERTLLVDGVTINNVDAMTINVADGDATITTVDSSTAATLTLNAVEDLTITNALATNLTTIDATGVTDAFSATLNDMDAAFTLTTGADATITLNDVSADAGTVIDGSAGDLTLVVTETYLSLATLTSVEAVNITEGSYVTLTADQVDTIGEENISGVDDGTAGNVQETLHVENLGSQEIIAANLGTDVVLGEVTMASGTNTLNPATDLTGATLFVPANGTLTLTADQYMALADLDGLDATDVATINITGLTQANIDAGFTLANVSNAVGTVSLAESLNLDSAALGAGHITTDLNGFSVIMSDNQTLGLATSTQADGLHVSGGVDTIVEYQFNTSTTAQIDASNYDIGTLRALNTFVDGTNVEYIIENLDSAITLSIYDDPTALNIVQNTDRVVIVEAGVDVAGELVFNDIQDMQELTSLTLTLEGGNDITGDLRLPTIDPSVAVDGRDDFGTLTINSQGTEANTITGSITAEPVVPANPAVATEVENNLLNVVINADTDLTIGTYDVTGDYVSGGNLVFTTNGTTAANATITLTGAANVTLHGFDIDDASGTINQLTVDTANYTGTLDVTGGTAAIMGDNAEALVLTGTGNIVFGSDVAGDGVESDTLSVIDASGLSGNLDLGTVIDTDDTDFAFTAGTGVTKVTLKDITLDADSDGADNIAGNADDEAGFSIDMSNAAAGSELHLLDNTYTQGKLNIDLGANTTLYIDSDTDLTNLDLTLSQTQNIVLADEVTLTLTAAQANGLNIVSGTDTDGDGVLGTVNVVNLGNDAVDLSGIATDIAGTATINPDVNGDGVAENDVTLDAATNLGDFTIGLTALDTSNTDLSGQTIRFQTVDQADNAIAVTGGDADHINSTNVVWLFDSVAAPVDTSGYSADLGRLWITPTLADGANVEDLYTTLPDSIIRVEFSSLTELDVLLSSAAVDRTVELVSFTDLPNGLTFSDQDILEHVQSLTINMGGQVTLGNLAIDNVVDNTVGTVTFSSLTINSARALTGDNYLAPENFVNDNDGTDEAGEYVQPNNINTVGDISVGAGNGLDLLTVNLNTLLESVVGDSSDGSGADLTVGTITFDSESSSSSAILNVSGDNDITIASLNTDDADISTLSINKLSGSGDLTVTGASPAAAVSNTENLLIDFGGLSTGNITLGTDNLTKPGVAGADLSLIEIKGEATTTITNLGVISLVDGVAQVDPATGTPVASFTLDTTDYKGNATATMSADSTNTPTLADGAVWLFNNVGSAGSLDVTFSDTVSLGAGTVSFSNVNLKIDGNVDFTGLSAINLINATTIDVPTGSTLTIDAADISGLTVTGDGTVEITNLEDALGADLSHIFTSAGDTGVLNVAVDTSDSDADGNPENLVFTGNLGVSHVTISGDGSFAVTGAMDATYDRDDDAATPDETVMTTFTVGSDATLNLTAAQADDRVADGAGTVAVADLGQTLDANLANITATTVTAAFDTTGTFTGDLGSAVVTIATGVDMQAAASVVSGKTINGLGTLSVDDENDGVGGAADTAVTPDLSNVSVANIEFVADAIVGAVTFPVLYGDPTDPLATVQTVTMTSVQADNQTITGTDNDSNGTIDTGRVIVNVSDVDTDADGDVDAFNLANITAASMTANVADTMTLDGAADLGTFDVVIADNKALTLSAAQADGLNITGDATPTGVTVNVTALEATPGADLSGIVANTETAQLDANGGVALSANLGTGMTVEVSDSVTGADTVTFTGTLNPDGTGAGTTFDIAADDLTLVFDANDANLLTVTNSNPAVATQEVVDLAFTGDMTGGAISVTVGGVVVTTNFNGSEAQTLIDLANAIQTEMTTQGYTLANVAVAADSITLTGDASGASMPTVASVDVSAATGYTNGTSTVTTAGVEPHSAVVVNNVDGDLVDFSHIDNTITALTANVPADCTLDAASDLGAFDLSLAEGVDLGLTTGQFLAVGAADITGTAGGVSETLIISNYNGQVIDSTTLGHDVVIQTLTVLDTNTNIDVLAATDFTNVQEIVIPDGTTLTMTADQFMQMGAAPVVSGGGTLNLTNFGDANVAIDLSNVTAHAGSISLDAADGIMTLDPVTGDPVGDIVLDPAAVIDNAAGEKFSITMTADDQAIAFSSETQADGRVVSGGTFDNNTVVLGFTSADAADADAVIESAGFDVENVYLITEYLHNEFGVTGTPANFEAFLNNLPSTTTDANNVVVTVYDADSLLQAGSVSPAAVTSYNRTVTIDHDVTVSADIAFDDLDTGTEVGNLTLNLTGNSVITGDLTLEQQLDPHSTDPVTIPTFFQTLTINSTDATAGTAANQIQGNIFADNGTDGSASESQVETFTLALDPNISIVGAAEQIAFEDALISLSNGDDTDAVGAKIAAASYTNWTATYDAAADTVTFVNKNVGDVTDATINDFTFTSNDASTANFPGTSSVAVVQQGIFQAEENNLLDVVINADHDLNIAGQLEFSYVTRSNAADDALATANLTINGNADVNIGSVDTSDEHINVLNYVHTGTGTVTAPGTSPAAAVGNTEILNITEGGALILGTAGDATKPGVAGDDLSQINVSGVGTVNLGVISSVDSNDFALTVTDGLPTAVSATLDGVTLADGGEWSFTGDDGARNLTVEIANATFTATTDPANPTTLTFDDVNLNLSGTVDFSGVDVTFTDMGTITTDGDLTLTAAQADGLTITGAGTVTITDLEDTPAADLDGIFTTAGDTGTVEVLVDTSDADNDGNPEDINFTGTLGVAHVTISGDGTFATTDPMPGFDRDSDVATPADTASFTVGAAATLNLTSAQADDREADGAGSVAVADLGLTLDANLANITATTVTAAFDTTGTFTGDLGTAVVTVGDGAAMTTSYTIATGHTINDDGDNTTLPQGTLVVTIDASESAANLATITSNMLPAQITANFIEDMTFTGSLAGHNAVIGNTSATDVDIEASVNIVDGLVITTTNANDSIYIPDLATKLDANLSGITGAGSETADFTADGTFTGDLGTVTVTIADGVSMTASAAKLVGKDVNKSGAGTNDGAVIVTMANADANVDTDNADGDGNPATGTFEALGYDLTTLVGGATGTAADITSITVLDSLTFTGTLHGTVATGVADGATLSTTAAIANGHTINMTGTTGAANIDMSVDAPATLAGSANFTVTGLVSDLTATNVTGSLNVTAADDAAMSVATGSGTNTIDATALADTHALTVTGDDAFTVSLTNGDVAAHASTGDMTLTATGTGSNVVTASQGVVNINVGDGNDDINMATYLTGADTVNGGTGTNTLTFTDNGSGTDDLNGVTFIDTVTLGDAATAITLVDATVAATESMLIDASALAAANALTLDASAEADGTVNVTGGAGDDDISFGTHLTSANTIDGKGGNDTLNFTDNGTGTDELDNVSNIESIVLGDATTSITLTDATATAALSINASALTAGHTFTLDASAESSEALTITGGADDDDITGGAGADVISGGAGDDTFRGFVGADTIDGGADDGTVDGDKIVMNAALTDLNAAGNGDIVNVETIDLDAGYTGNLDLSNQDDGFEILTVSGQANTVTGSTGDDRFWSYGTDTLTGNGGDDKFVIGSAATTTIGDFNNGDSIAINNGGTVTATLTGGYIATADTSNAGGTGTIDMATNNVTYLDMSAATDNGNGACAWVLNGSAGDDTIVGTGVADTITGGAGDDTITLGAAGDVDTVAIAFGGEGQDTINDFTATEDVIDFTGVNDVAGTGITVGGFGTADLTGGAVALSQGLTVVNDTNTAALSTTAEIAAALAGTAAGSTGNALTFANADNVVYIVLDNGTDSVLIKADDQNGDTNIDAGDITIIGTLSGLANASTLTNADFADFA